MSETHGSVEVDCREEVGEVLDQRGSPGVEAEALVDAVPRALVAVPPVGLADRLEFWRVSRFVIAFGRPKRTLEIERYRSYHVAGITLSEPTLPSSLHQSPHNRLKNLKAPGAHVKLNLADSPVLIRISACF